MWCTNLSAQLARIEQQGRSGGVDWRPPMAVSNVTQRPLDPDLDRLFDAAWRQGLPIGGSIAALRIAVVDAADLCRSADGLSALFRMRMAIGLVAALATRYGFLYGRGLLVVNARDRSAILLAVAVITAAVVVLSTVSPSPWLGRRQLNAGAYAWLQAHIEADHVAGAPMGPELRQLRQRELLLGVSLQREKRTLLEQWAKDQINHGQRRVRRVEDLMPLWELVGVGLPMVLLLMEVLRQVIDF